MVTDQSPTVLGLPEARQIRCSVRTQDTTAMERVSKPASPKANTANAVIGSRASTTLNMMVSTL